MWLLPAIHRLSGIAVRTFYRLEVAGAEVPRHGPVLLVANHPNSLLDAALVMAAARRPVRFLAKAPLFTDRTVGWMVRASGSVPVHRRADDPGEVDRNEDAFREVERALAGGAAVGIFPEGVSHSAPALATLRTGAARIALGAAAQRNLVIVPVGLSFRDKATFRSGALAVVGPPVRWDDLAGAPPEAGAVRELTRRIECALRELTPNLERWEDAPLVECAERVYVAEHGFQRSEAERVRNLREASEGLARLRRAGNRDGLRLAREVRRHCRTLRALGTGPEALGQAPRGGVALGWTLRHLASFVLGGPVATLGALLFYPPYRATGMLERRAHPEPDVRATVKVLYGALLHLGWTLLLAALAGWLFGIRVGLAVLLLLSLLAFATLAVRDRWSDARGQALRYLQLRRRPELIPYLQERQRALADRLDALRVQLRG